jgi:hypothetical protein
MTPSQVALALAVAFTMMVALATLLVRGRWRWCLAFVAYLTLALTFNLGVVLWPERFFRFWWWILVHGLFDALKAGMVLEAAARIALRPVRRATEGRFQALLLGSFALYQFLYVWLPAWLFPDGHRPGSLWQATEPYAYLLLVGWWACLAAGPRWLGGPPGTGAPRPAPAGTPATRHTPPGHRRAAALLPAR